MMGLGLGAARGVVPVLPGARAPRRGVRRVPGPAHGGPPGHRQRDPSRTRPRTARSAPRRSARWRTTPSRRRSLPPSTTPSASWVTQLPATPGAGPAGARRARHGAAPRGQARDLRRGHLSITDGERDAAQGLLVPMADASRRSAPGTASSARSSWTACACTAIGGEQVLLCRVTYEPGKQVRLHATKRPSR